MGSSASQGAMGPYMAAPPKKACKADFCVPAIAVSTQVELLVLDCPPQPFNEDVVVAPLPSRPADLDRLSLQADHEVGGVNWHP